MKKIINLAYSVYHWSFGLIGAIRYHFPSRKLVVIGVTGTKGKSTTLALISDILEKSGHKTALISSVTYKIGSRTEKNRTGNSMPGRFFLQKFLSDAVNSGCDTALIEVTSQGVVQHRHKFIFWDRAVFLNIHPEHIESHGSFENYLDAKLDFFRYVADNHDSKMPQLFVCSDDAHVQEFIDAAGTLPIVRFSKKTVEPLKIKFPKTLSGDFNKINTAAAVAVARSFQISDDKIREAIEGFGGLEGRMDVVVQKPFTAIVDYAHTPDSLEAVYKHLREGLKKCNLICVLGSAGGGRDRWKRPIFGSLAAKYCDYAIFTNEDPHDEDPLKIAEEIEKGYLDAGGKKTKCEIIIDRRGAIKKAVEVTKAGDVIICTGKGSEEYIHLAKGKKIPWSEKDVIKSVIRT